jgi:uncharacterized protein (TIGR02444 family)
MALEFEDHPFWDFSLAVYGTGGVPAACLVLQDRYQIDVNVMLFCCWIGHSGRGVMDDGELTQALDAVAGWHEEIVRALRAVRQRLKGGLPPAPEALRDALRRRILKSEVDSEHTEQLMLAASVRRPADETLDAEQRARDGLKNIAAYFSRHGCATEGADADQLAIIPGAAFGELDEAQACAMCRELMA